MKERFRACQYELHSHGCHDEPQETRDNGLRTPAKTRACLNGEKQGRECYVSRFLVIFHKPWLDEAKRRLHRYVLATALTNLGDEILEIVDDSSHDYVEKTGVDGKVTRVVDREPRLKLKTVERFRPAPTSARDQCRVLIP